MAKDTFWVLIETDTDRFDNPDDPTKSEIWDVLRNEGNYGIIDYVRESDIEEVVLKPVNPVN